MFNVIFHRPRDDRLSENTSPTELAHQIFQKISVTNRYMNNDRLMLILWHFVAREWQALFTYSCSHMMLKIIIIIINMLIAYSI